MADKTPASAADPPALVAVHRTDQHKGDKTALLNVLKSQFPDVHGWVQTQKEASVGRFAVRAGDQAELLEKVVAQTWEGSDVESRALRWDMDEIDFSKAGVKLRGHGEGVVGKDDWSGGKENKKKSVLDVLRTASDAFSKSGDSMPASAVEATRAAESIEVQFADGQTRRYAGFPFATIGNVVTNIPLNGGELFVTKEGGVEEAVSKEAKTSIFSEVMVDRVLKLRANWCLPVPPPPAPPTLRRDLPAEDMPMEEFGKLVGLDEEDVGEIRRAKVMCRDLNALALKSEHALNDFLERRVPGLAAGPAVRIVGFYFPPAGGGGGGRRG